MLHTQVNSYLVLVVFISQTKVISVRQSLVLFFAFYIQILINSFKTLCTTINTLGLIDSKKSVGQLYFVAWEFHDVFCLCFLPPRRSGKLVLNLPSIGIHLISGRKTVFVLTYYWDFANFYIIHYIHIVT